MRSTELTEIDQIRFTQIILNRTKYFLDVGQIVKLMLKAKGKTTLPLDAKDLEVFITQLTQLLNKN